jgi:monofunctional biosynthetic peptidoglycan transglycosylase
MPQRAASVKHRHGGPFLLRCAPAAGTHAMIRTILKGFFWAAGVYVVAILVLVPVYSVVSPISTYMIGRWLTFERVVRDWQSLEKISPNLVHAVVVSEDARLCSHWGVDWNEVRDALEEADELSEARGASTIAMQTARNLFLWPGRNLVRKAMEVPIAYYISLVWSPRRLIEVYLNIAEWGPNGEFGAEAAAQRAFGKSAARLSRREAALLAGSLPDPVRRNAARPAAGLSRVASRTVSRMTTDGGLSVECLELER